MKDRVSEQQGNASTPFVDELHRRLVQRHLSWRKLAELTGYHPSWLSKIRNGRPPSPELVQRCDEVLEAQGALIALAAAGEIRPAHLPTAPAGFVGRDAEIRQIVDALTRTRPTGMPAIVAIGGPPGVGKTATALRSAHDVLAPELKAYAHGQLHADLGGYSPDGRPASPGDVLREFLLALGVPESDIPVSLDQRAKLYRSLLASKQVLIVLDNAASSAQVEPLLPSSVTCGVIVTSRLRLVGLAMRTSPERIVLQPMTGEESRALLRMAVGPLRADAEAEAIDELARLCGRLPLALRLAAERIAIHPFRPVRELVSELGAEKQRLDGLDTHDSVSVRTVFDWSYRELNRAETRMIRLLSLYPGNQTTVDAAAALAGIPIREARHLLEKLVGVHLLQGVPGNQYRLPDLHRIYATERLRLEDTEESRRAAVSRLAVWYLGTVTAGARTLAPYRTKLHEPPLPYNGYLRFEDRQTALQWCDAESQNFVPIIRLAVEQGLHETAWRLAMALSHYFRLLRRPARLWVDTQCLALGAAQATNDRHTERLLELPLAEAHRRLRQYGYARHLLDQSVELSRQAGDRHGEAWALVESGLLAVEQERLEDADALAGEALAIFRELGDRHGTASALYGVAEVRHAQDKQEDALSALEDAILIFSGLEDYDGRGAALAKQADVHVSRDDLAKALDCLDDALRAWRMAGSHWGEAEGLTRRGRVLWALDRHEEAQTSWKEALPLYEQIDDSQAARLRALLCTEAKAR